MGLDCSFLVPEGRVVLGIMDVPVPPLGIGRGGVSPGRGG